MPAPPQLMAAHREETFTAVFDRHFGAVHGYVARRLGRDVADDVAAETFLTAFRLRDRFDASRGGTEVKAYYVAVLSTGWTDETPGVPSVDVP